MKKDVSKLTKAQRAELAALEALPEAEINTHEIPEQKDWTGGQRGVFFRPVKKQLTLRLDADLIEWFRQRTTGGDGYQTRINNALRDYVKTHHGQ